MFDVVFTVKSGEFNVGEIEKRVKWGMGREKRADTLREVEKITLTEQ